MRIVVVIMHYCNYLRASLAFLAFSVIVYFYVVFNEISPTDMSRTISAEKSNRFVFPTLNVGEVCAIA